MTKDEMNQHLRNTCNMVWMSNDDNEYSHYVTAEPLDQRQADSLINAVRSMFMGALNAIYARPVAKTEKVDFRVDVHVKLNGKWSVYDVNDINICGIKFAYVGAGQKKDNVISRAHAGQKLRFAHLLEDGTIITTGTVVHLRTSCSDWYYGKVTALDNKTMRVDCSAAFLSRVETFNIGDIAEIEVLQE